VAAEEAVRQHQSRSSDAKRRAPQCGHGASRHGVVMGGSISGNLVEGESMESPSLSFSAPPCGSDITVMVGPGWVRGVVVWGWVGSKFTGSPSLAGSDGVRGHGQHTWHGWKLLHAIWKLRWSQDYSGYRGFGAAKTEVSECARDLPADHASIHIIISCVALATQNSHTAERDHKILTLPWSRDTGNYNMYRWSKQLKMIKTASAVEALNLLQRKGAWESLAFTSE